MTQEEINELLIDHARAGRIVVRLKGGDPLVFGRGGEEALALRTAGIPFEIVPGVTAGLGVTAYAGIPVTHRTAASAVAFVTGHGDPEREPGHSRLDWPALARFPGYARRLHGSHPSRGDLPHLDPPGEARRHAGRGDRSRDPRLAAHPGRHPGDDRSHRAWRRALAPLLSWLSGSVVDLREELHWFERLPLFGQRIVITRPREEAGRAAAVLEALGAEVLVAPTVEVAPITDPAPLDAAIDRLDEYEWLVFTSANGVRFFLRRLEERGRDLRALGHLKLAAIGPATAEALARFHLRADLVPESYRSEALAAALGQAAQRPQNPAGPRRPRTNPAQG